ncbi:hypothetical protein EZV62_009374 [Acer yangbiense]|uniref:Uncharacterized protein n=1 Tax=Acer yangbiense TaxID=1000413 RepID=A0A5C7IGG1_9ROSI|nr:hypothetical protein EZV62_009374 [Acer yangbiense]
MGSSSTQILLRKTTSENMNPNWEQLWVTLNKLWLLGLMRRSTNGGLEIVVAMLNLCNDDTRRYLLEILSALTLMREARRVLSSLGGLRFLVEAARCGSMVSRERACQEIGLLGVRRLARSRHVELGVIPVLVELFCVGDSTTKVEDNAVSIAEHWVRILKEGDDESKTVAADVFCDVSVYKHSIHVVRSSGAIPILVNL